MKQAKIGMMTLSLPPEISTVPKEQVELADNYGDRIEAALKSAGLCVVRIKQQVQNEAAAVAATDALESQNVDCVMYMIGSWLHMPIITTPASKLRKPLIIYAPADPHVTALSTSCIIHGSFDELGIKHGFVYGRPEDPWVVKDIHKYAAAAMVINHMNGSKYGLYGGRCMYMYTGMPDLIQVKKLFGVETAHFDQHALIEEAKRIEESLVSDFLAGFKQRFKNIQVPDEVLHKSIRLHLALTESVRENELDFVGVKCIPEVAGDYGTYCLSVSLSLDSGLVVSCEADTNAALTMQVLKILSGKAAPSADVKTLDMEKGILRLINCGALPTTMANGDDDIIWYEQYDSLVASKPGTGACPSFVCSPGRITLARLARISGEYVMQIAGASAYSVPREGLGGVRDRWPQIFAKLDCETDEFLKNCRSNHMHWAYGDYRGELVDFCNMLNIRPIIC